MLIVALGDLVLDVVVRLRQPLAAGGDASAQITLEAGGQAANVAAWAATYGARARWIGKRADDDAGRIAASRLESRGVELEGAVAVAGNGVIVSLVDPGGERSMCPDRGVATELTPDELEPGWLQRRGLAARIGIRALPATAPRCRAPGRRARPRLGCTRQRRPGVVERDTRLGPGER